MDAPTGTVTLVFTDIEGSTSLWEKHRERFKPVLEEHNRIMRQAAEACGGYEVKTEGDAFFVAFSRGGDKNNYTMALESMATIHVGLGRFEAALDIADRCIAIRRETNDRGGLLDALSVRAAALRGLGRDLDAEAQCDELLALGIDLKTSNDELLARLRCALCGRPGERNAHLARAVELAASPELVNEDKEVLLGLVQAEFEPDQAAADRTRRTLLARSRFSTKLMDVIYRAHAKLGPET